MKVDKDITDKNQVLLYTLIFFIAGALLLSMFWN